jgi:hypothetical protein
VCYWLRRPTDFFAAGDSSLAREVADGKTEPNQPALRTPDIMHLMMASEILQWDLEISLASDFGVCGVI